MSNFTVDELAKRDFFNCLGVWIVLEFASFILLPRIGLIDPVNRLQAWLYTSVPLGIAGAILSAASSRFLAIANDRYTGSQKSSRMLMGQIMGGIGLVALIFPLLFVVVEFFAKISAGIES